MAPERYIQARQSSLGVDDDLIEHDIDGKAYRPNLRVVSPEDAKAAAALFLSGKHDVTNLPVVIDRISGGITNVLYKVSGLSSVDSNAPDAVLVRIFGAEGMIDRDIENSTFAALSRSNLAPPYYGRFANGRMEGWMEGMRPLQVRDLSEPNISLGIAESMARLHNDFNIPEHLQNYYKVEEPSMWSQLETWFQQAVGNSFQTKQDTERASKLNIARIRQELDWLQSSVIPKDAAVAFCHNDVLAANVLYDEGTRRIQLIDFEYGGINYLAFDIANHFNEYAGGTDNGGFPNYEWLPSVSDQKRFLERYLTTAHHGVVPNDSDVMKLLEEVESFLMADHLYWGLWAVNQAATEGCASFDYLEFAKNRLEQYRVCKEDWTSKHKA